MSDRNSGAEEYLASHTSLVQHVDKLHKGQRMLIGCLLVLLISVTGMMVTLWVQGHEATHRFDVQTQRYHEAKRDRVDLHEQLCDALRLLQDQHQRAVRNC